MQLQLPIHIRDVKEAETVARGTRGSGGERARTADPQVANLMLSQLSYAPVVVGALERVSGPGLT